MVPSVAQIRELTRLGGREVPPAYVDENGHLNTVRYLDIHNEAGWAWFDRFGLGKSQASDGSAGSFDVEHSIRYVREVHEGDAVSVHGRLLARNDKLLHLVQFLVNDSTETVANLHEVVVISIDMSIRRAVTWPPHVIELIDAQLSRDEAVGWPFEARLALPSRSAT